MLAYENDYMVPKKSRWLGRYPITIAFISVFILFSWIKCSYAQVVTVQGVICDTDAQAIELLTTHRYEGFEKAKLTFSRLNKERNEVNEPRCAHDTYTVLLVKEVASLEDVRVPNVGNMEGFVYEVMTIQGGTFYILLFKPMERV